MASTDFMAYLYAKVSFHLSSARPYMPMYTHLILSALFPIYTGAHASLSRPSSAEKSVKKGKKLETDDDEEDDEDEEKIQKMEGLSNKDAVILPITAGVVLAGLYFLIMRYGADTINFIMGWYFSGVGVYSVTQLVNDGLNVLTNFVFPTYYASGGSLWKVTSTQYAAVRQDNSSQTRDSPLPPLLNVLPLLRGLKTALWSLRRASRQKYTTKAYIQTIIDLKANLTIVNVFSAFVGLGTIIYVNTVSKPWFLTNLQGFAVSYSALQLMSPTTFATGSLILGALFCYDIWAVFFTPFMVGVAKNLDQPIKLVFPRPAEPSTVPGKPPTRSYSMLGLGDIVLPGIMIGLALRFDLYMFYLKKQKRRQQLNDDSSDLTKTDEITKKAPYIPVTGHWGDRFWTFTLADTDLPTQLRSTFPKPYFIATTIGYVIGMLVTLGVMSVFRHAQPALLYLVPGVLISLWSTALLKGELKQMWHFSEAVSGEQVAESDDKGKQAGTQVADRERPRGLFERLWAEIWPASEDKTQLRPNDGSSSVSGKSDKESGTRAVDDKEGDHKPDDLLFGFSISHYNRQTPTSRRASVGSNGETVKQTESPSRSESSEDAVLVSPDALDGSEEQEDAIPRYRTRSTRATQA